MTLNIPCNALPQTLRMAFVLAALASGTLALASPGDLDPRFGTAGISRLSLSDASAARITHPAVQPDGKIVLCGTRTANGVTASDFFVARLNANGALDSTFSFDGKVAIDFDGGAVAQGDICSALALQPDGKIVVAGTTQNAAFVSAFALARLNTDGTLDATFGAGGKVTIRFDTADQEELATAVAVQADGKIVVAGVHNNANNDDFAVMRLLANGALDSTFGTKGKVSIAFDLGGSNSDFANAMAIDGDGNIVVGGYASNAASTLVAAVARLDPLGKPDANFNANGRATIAFTPPGGGSVRTIEATSMVIQHDGRIVLAGVCDASTSMQDNLDFSATRIFPDGSIDASFGSNGTASVAFDLVRQGSDVVYDVIEQADGKLLLAGAATGATSTSAMARLNADGSADETFGVHGKDTYVIGTAVSAFIGVALQGEQVVALGFEGDSNGSDYVVARLQHDDEVFFDTFEVAVPQM